jgi:UDP-N-acetylmuramate-alanine ligase
MDELAEEYEYFIKLMNKNGYLILNHDNERIKKLAEFKNGETIFFGLNDNGRENYWRAEVMEKTLNGQKIRITENGQAADHEINRFGQHHVYALLVGLIVKKIVLSFKQ